MPKAAITCLFLEGRTHHHWLERPVDDGVLHELYELARMPPTSANTQPMRLVFVRSAEAKERLKPAIWPNNVDKVLAALSEPFGANDFSAKAEELFPGLVNVPIKKLAAGKITQVPGTASRGTKYTRA